MMCFSLLGTTTFVGSNETVLNKSYTAESCAIFFERKTVLGTTRGSLPRFGPNTHDNYTPSVLCMYQQSLPLAHVPLFLNS